MIPKPFASWSPFNVGFQLDLVYNQLVKGTAGDTSTGCAGRAAGADAAPGPLPVARNGIQIFPGSFAIYRGSQLIGAVGVSGDGIDQDDMVGFLGLANAGAALGNSIANAPPGIRADTIAPQGEGTRLRYANCPQAPFNDSTQQNACAGI